MPFRHPLLPESAHFQEESLSEVQARYSGFGKDLFAELEAQLPEIISNFRFFHKRHNQEEDAWAIYADNNIEFAVILDPDCAVIVLFDGTPGNTIEIGTWWDNPTEVAIAFIEEVFFGKEPSGKFSFD